MTPLEDTLIRLQAEAEARAKARQGEREALWARIRAEAPEVAGHAQLMRAVFGGELVLVDLDGERVLEKPAGLALEAGLERQAKRAERNRRELTACLGIYNGYRRVF